MPSYRVQHWSTSQSLEVVVEADRIRSVTPIADDSTLPVIFPLYFDLQVNGGLGIDFTSGLVSPDDVRTVTAKLREHRTGGFLPTVITSNFETMLGSIASLTKGLETDAELARVIPGFHLEGPYLSEIDGPRGAHPREHIRNPDWDEFQQWQDAARGRIRLMTVAPERPGAIDFIRKLTANAVTVAIGHTNADAATLYKAVEAGARFSTHLGNGCHAVMPRHTNVIWEQLACDDLGASIIADGHHLPDSVLKTILRAKTAERLVLISDASPLAGLPAGRYQNWGQDILIEQSGRIGVAGTPFLAGSGSFLDQCVQHMMTATGLAFRDAVQLASVNPRLWLGLPVPELVVDGDWRDFSVAPLPGEGSE
ncbi:hypothetical protein BH11PLA2_BH11PLA2_39910 [soil metagenome]